MAVSRGVNIHAGQPVEGDDRAGTERLCRYLLRPPLSKERISLRPDGRVELTFKRAWRDGTKALLLEPEDLLARLVAAIPPPRQHQLRYFGVLSSHSKLRPEVVSGRAPTDDDDADHRASRAPPPLVTLAPPPRNDMRATCAHARFRGSLSLYALKEGTGGGGHVNSSLELVAYSSPRLSRLVALGCGNADAKAIYAKPGVWLCNKCTTRSAMGHFTPRGAETCGRRATPRSPGG